MKLLYVEDPVHGVAFLEFGAPGHIDADIRLVATEGGPDFFARRAEEMAGPGVLPTRDGAGPAYRGLSESECGSTREMGRFQRGLSFAEGIPRGW